MRPKIRVACHATQGRGHASKSVVCQDKVHAVRFRDKRSAFIGLADGAGSCVHSDIGAELTVTTLPLWLDGRFEHYRDMRDETVAREISEMLHERLQGQACSIGVDIHEMACTVLFVFVRRRRHHTLYLAGHLGDGVIVLEDDKGLRTLSAPAKGEFANTTFLLTGPSVQSNFRICRGVVTGNAGFLLMSDGAADSLYQRATGALAPACGQMLSWLNRLPQRKVGKVLKANMEGVLGKMTRDDCGVAMLKVTSGGRAPRSKKRYAGSSG